MVEGGADVVVRQGDVNVKRPVKVEGTDVVMKGPDGVEIVLKLC